MKRTFSVLLLGGLAALAAGTASAAPRDVTPLVSVHARLVFRLVKTDLVDENLFLAADGTASGDLTASRISNPWVATMASAKGSASQLAALGSALTAAHVGLRKGSCTIPVTTGWNGTYEVTWYGKGDRTSNFVAVLTFAAQAEPPLCPSAITDLIEAIEQYASGVLGFAARPELH